MQEQAEAALQARSADDAESQERYFEELAELQAAELGMMDEMVSEQRIEFESGYSELKRSIEVRRGRIEA